MDSFGSDGGSVVSFYTIEYTVRNQEHWYNSIRGKDTLAECEEQCKELLRISPLVEECRIALTERRIIKEFYR